MQTRALASATHAVVIAPAERRARVLDVEALYRRYGDMVVGRCRNLLGNDAYLVDFQTY